MLTRNIASEYGEYNIQCNGIGPGYIATPQTAPPVSYTHLDVYKRQVNVCGHTTEEYIDVVERLSDQPVDLLEINISCPNVKEGGIAFGQNPKMVEEVTKEMKRHAKQPVIMKLSPNVTDITEMARAAEAGGADALSMILSLIHI